LPAETFHALIFFGALNFFRFEILRDDRIPMLFVLLI